LATSTSVVFHEPGAGWYFGSGRVGTSRTARMAVTLSPLFSSRNDNGAGSGKRAPSARPEGDSPARLAAAPVLKKVRRFMARSPGGSADDEEANPVAPCSSRRSGEQLRDDPSADVGEAEVAALEAVGQPRVVEAEQVQDRGMIVVDVHRVLDDVPP